MVKKVANTNTNSMFVKMFYGPKKPRIGCDMKFIIEFMKPYSSDLFEHQVHYDILRVDIIDGQTVPTYSAANDEGRDHFWSAGGKVLRYWLLEGEPGLQTFAILIKGVGQSNSNRLEIEIIDTNDQIIVSLQTPITSDGMFSLPWNIPADINTGVYTINVSDAVNSSSAEIFIQ